MQYAYITTTTPDTLPQSQKISGVLMETTGSVFFVVLGWFFWTEFFTGWSFSVTGLGDGYFPVVSSLVWLCSQWECVLWGGRGRKCVHTTWENFVSLSEKVPRIPCVFEVIRKRLIFRGEVGIRRWVTCYAIRDSKSWAWLNLRWDFLGDVKTSLVNMLCDKITWSGQVAKFSKGCKIRRWFIFSEEFMQLDFGCENYFLFPVTWYATCEKKS